MPPGSRRPSRSGVRHGIGRLSRRRDGHLYRRTLTPNRHAGHYWKAARCAVAMTRSASRWVPGLAGRAHHPARRVDGAHSDRPLQLPRQGAHWAPVGRSRCLRPSCLRPIEERKAVADLGGIEEKRAKPGGDQEVVRWSTLAMPLLTVPLTKPRWRQGAHMCDTNRNASARQKCYAGCLTGNCICRRCQEAQ